MKKLKLIGTFFRSATTMFVDFFKFIFSLFNSINECRHKFQYKKDDYSVCRECSKCGRLQYFDFYYDKWKNL